jgi:predicted O-methyltransferase YrrM
VWNGKTENTPFSEKQIKVMRSFNERILQDPNWDGFLVPTDEGLLVAKWNPRF